MSIKGYKFNGQSLKMLSDDQIAKIHSSTIKVLKETGIKTDHEKAKTLFKRNGCIIEEKFNMVKFPEDLVEECIKRVPKKFSIRARDPNNNINIDESTVYFGGLPGMNFVDAETGEQRQATKKDYIEGVKILDSLESVHFLPWYTPYFGFKEAPPILSMIEDLLVRLEYSSKVTGTAYQKDCELFTIEIAKILEIDLISFMSFSPPLSWHKHDAEATFRFVEAGFPIMVGSATGTYGATYPATVAGSLVLGNAEVMAGIVLSQLIKPGTNIFVLDFSFPLDMRTGLLFFGNIASSLHMACFNQIWKYYYKVPVISAPCYTNSKISDLQCGYEKTIGALVAALSGANIILMHGAIYGELAYSPVQSILDDDIASMIGKLIEGVDINEETLAVDLINRVGPLPGSYLSEEHTLKWWKDNQFIPKAADGLSQNKWLETGKKIALDYAKERMGILLKNYKHKPILGEQKDRINLVRQKAVNYYKQKGML